MDSINKDVERDSRFNQNQNIDKGKLKDLKQISMNLQGSLF